jgi:UDP-glucose 4-epimerase
MQNKSENKTILITGGCGFIGSHLTLLLKKKKFRVIVIDNLSIGKKQLFRGDKFYKIDITKTKELEKVFKENKFFAIFHLAGLSKLTESFKKKNLYKNNNIRGTKNIIDFTKKYKVRYLIFSSSASVYGKQKKFPINENSSLKPISYYGKTKLTSENLIRKCCSKNYFKSICLRYFNVIGSNYKNKLGEVHNPPIHLIPIFIKKIINNKPIQIRSNFNTKDKSGVRDYIDVNDMAKAHYLCLKKITKIKKNFFVLNLGSKKYFSVKEIVEIISKKIKSKKIKISYSKKLKGEPDKLIANGRLANKILGWSPKVKIEKSITDMILWEKYKLKNKKKFIN